MTTRELFAASVAERPAVDLPPPGPEWRPPEPTPPEAIWGPPVVGIDPGLSGAIARIDYLGDAKVWDMPTVKLAKGSDYDVPAIVRLLRAQCPAGSLIVLEELHAMPMSRPGAPAGAAAVANFKLGVGFGGLRWMVQTLQALGEDWQLERVATMRWRARMLDGMPKGKESSLIKARELYPRAPLTAKSHHGRAEALLLATYGRRFLR